MNKSDILKDLSDEIFAPIDNDITTNKEEDNINNEVSLNDINTILEQHFSEVEDNNISLNDINNMLEDNNTNIKEEDIGLMDYEDEDVTFNDLNNRTQEINIEELKEVLEQLESSQEEETVVEEEEKIDTNIESSFPILDRFGSVFPIKNI